eukprot:3137744-Prymnesium_polylepis.1
MRVSITCAAKTIGCCHATIYLGELHCSLWTELVPIEAATDKKRGTLRVSVASPVPAPPSPHSPAPPVHLLEGVTRKIEYLESHATQQQ